MDTELASTLGALQATIYWLHDAEDFDRLAATASKIYQALGYSEDLSNQAGIFISEAYRISDNAEIARYADRKEEELKHYAEARVNLELVAQLFDFPTVVAEYQVKWWKYFRHKQVIKALWNLFRQHAQPLGLAHTAAAIKITYFLLQVGLAHNQRDFSKCEKNAIHYWKILLKVCQDGCPYLG